jgi:hypothetical protein
MTTVWGKARSGVDHRHVTAVAVVTHDERPDVAETNVGAPLLVLRLTSAGVELSAGIENTPVTTTLVPAVGFAGDAVIVAAMFVGVCALTGAPRRTRAAPRTANAESTFFICSPLLCRGYRGHHSPVAAISATIERLSGSLTRWCFLPLALTLR